MMLLRKCKFESLSAPGLPRKRSGWFSYAEAISAVLYCQSKLRCIIYMLLSGTIGNGDITFIIVLFVNVICDG